MEPTLTIEGEYQIFEYDGSIWRIKGEINDRLARAIAMFLSKQDRIITKQEVKDL